MIFILFTKLQRPIVIRSLLLATMLSAALFMAPLRAADGKYEPIARDIEILEQILKTAIATAQTGQTGGDGFSRLSQDINGIYLEGQGMVFFIRSLNFNISLRPYHVLLKPSVGQSIEHVFVRSEPNQGEDLQRKLMETEVQLKSIEEWQRVIARERSIEARITSPVLPEMNTQVFAIGAGAARGEQSEKLQPFLEHHEAAIKALREEQVKLAEKMKGNAELSDAERKSANDRFQQLRENLVKTEGDLAQALEEINAEREKQMQAMQQGLEDRVLDTLCRYAGSTRGLAKNEHVSLVFSSNGQVGGRNNEANIWVIKKTDLERCAASDQAAGFLQKNAVNYKL